MDCAKVTGLEQDWNPAVLSLIMYKEIKGGKVAVWPQTAIPLC